jgi:hypothetical protein
MLGMGRESGMHEGPLLFAEESMQKQIPRADSALGMTT